MPKNNLPSRVIVDINGVSVKINQNARVFGPKATLERLAQEGHIRKEMEGEFYAPLPVLSRAFGLV